MPRSLAILPTSVGSMPSMRWPPFWKFEISVPSFEPMSTTRSSCARAEHRRRLGVELGEIVAQHLGHAAGVGIFRREDDDRIDGEPELHQLAVARSRAAWSGTTAAAAAPGRPAPSGSPAACSRATARSRAARARRPGSIRPGRCAPVPAARATFAGNNADSSVRSKRVRQDWRRKAFVGPVPVDRRRQARRRAAPAAR